jgi:nucleotide-binding universal stress UspA family protein
VRTTVRHVASDRVAESILDVAGTLASPLIAMAPCGHGEAMTRALGTVATSVVRHSPVPVVVRRPQLPMFRR